MVHQTMYKKTTVLPKNAAIRNAFCAGALGGGRGGGGFPLASSLTIAPEHLAALCI